MSKKENKMAKKLKAAIQKGYHCAKDILCSSQGSGLVEYIGIAAAVLVIIAVVILPAMKNLFNVDVFPGLTSAVEKIFKFS